MLLDLGFGYFEASIVHLLARYPSFVEGYDCVITCLDSGMNTGAALSRCLPDANVKALGPFAVISGEVATAHKRLIFSGFDEIYVYPREDWRDTDPRVWIDKFTSDQTFLRDEIPRDLLATFLASGASHYASDGTGLNLIMKDKKVFRAVAGVLSGNV